MRKFIIPSLPLILVSVIALAAGYPWATNDLLTAADLNAAISGSRPVIPTMASTGFSTFATTQGTATIADSAAGVVISDSDQGSLVIRAACKTAPTAPYTLTGRFSLTAAFGGTGTLSSWGGFAWRDSATGKITGFGIINETPINRPAVFSINFTNATTAGGSSDGSVETFLPSIWIQIADTGTNVVQSYSMDGANFNTLSSQAKSAGFLGATGYNQVCLFVAANGSAAKLSLNSYTQQ